MRMRKARRTTVGIQVIKLIGKADTYMNNKAVVRNRTTHKDILDAHVTRLRIRVAAALCQQRRVVVNFVPQHDKDAL